MSTVHLDRFSAVTKVIGYQIFGTESCQNTRPLSYLVNSSIDLDNQGKIWKMSLISCSVSEQSMLL